MVSILHDFLKLFSPAAFVFANKGVITSEKDGVGTSTDNLYTKWDHDVPTVGCVIYCIL